MEQSKIIDTLETYQAPLHLGGGEVDASAAITMDLSFIESMAVGLKGM